MDCMTGRNVVIVGAGGHGREVLDILRAQSQYDSGLAFKGFVADEQPAIDLLGRLNATWLGAIDDYLSRSLAGSFVIGVGDSKKRAHIANKFEAKGHEPVTLIHPTATLGEDVHLDPGVVIASHVSITTNVRIGQHTHINLNATVSHDCRISGYVTISPHCSVSGNVILKEQVSLGTNSTILQGLTVGKGSVVGAGAVVISDVAPYITVAGIPARPL
jgi:sugar O-acyltransferase (sialic acid O-acetyltransferase NeuD family)